MSALEMHVLDSLFQNACSLYCLLSMTWAHCVSCIPLQLFCSHLLSPHSNMLSWKENLIREELRPLLFLVFVNMDDGKIKNWVISCSRPSFISKRARHVLVVASRAWENFYLPGCRTCRTNREGWKSFLEAVCCSFFTPERGNFWPDWVLSKVQPESS